MRDPNDPRDTSPRIGSPLWIYLTAVTGAGCAVLALAMVSLAATGLPTLDETGLRTLLEDGPEAARAAAEAASGA